MGERAKNRHRRASEEGAVLLLVLLLVVMFTGLGVIAMRHTRGEMRSASAYYESVQTSTVAEGALMLAASDIKNNWDNPPGANYRTQFMQDTLVPVDTDGNVGQVGEFKVSFSSDIAGFCPGGLCPAAGQVPDAHINGTQPLDVTPTLAYSSSNVSIFFRAPTLAPPPQGFSSSDDEGRNFDWYYFDVRSSATYGTPWETAKNVLSGQAQARARLMIGPLTSMGR